MMHVFREALYTATIYKEKIIKNLKIYELLWSSSWREQRSNAQDAGVVDGSQQGSWLGGPPGAEGWHRTEACLSWTTDISLIEYIFIF